jgi:sensor domain CHASE-containing protein
MNKWTVFGFIKRPEVTGVFVFSALLLLTQLIAYQHYQLFQSTKYREEINAANLAKEKLQRALANSLSATQTLSFIVKTYGIKEDFDVVGKQILESNHYVDAIELLKGGTIINVYPLKGNESVIGYNILTDSARNIEAEKAIAKRDLFFAGPFKLKQGGVAIVGRLPIFIDEKFWGFAVTLVKLSTLIDALGIDTSANSDYLYQLSKVNPQTNKEEFYLPHAKAFNKKMAVWTDVPTGD